jgi:hypothetical protein
MRKLYLALAILVATSPLASSASAALKGKWSLIFVAGGAAIVVSSGYESSNDCSTAAGKNVHDTLDNGGTPGPKIQYYCVQNP